MSFRLFISNFDFEHQIAPNPRSAGSAKTRRVAQELSTIWLAIACEDDALWMPVRPDERFFTDMVEQGFPRLRRISCSAELLQSTDETCKCCPWGWSEAIFAWAKDHRFIPQSPALAVVCAANSRRFSSEWEQQSGSGLEHSFTVQSLDDWEAGVLSYPVDGCWVLKSEFGMSARERVLGQGRSLNPKQIAWAKKRLHAGQWLFLEPWVEPLAEAGLQFHLPPVGHGPPEYLGVVPLLNDRAGAYRGSWFAGETSAEFDWSEAISAGLDVAARLQEQGYFGPLGIDAMWYRDAQGDPKLRPVQDVNARWTMGRISLGFRSLCQEDEAGAWLHFRCPANSFESSRTWWQELTKSLPAEVRLLRTSALLLDNQVVQHATAALFSPDRDALEFSLRTLLPGFGS